MKKSSILTALLVLLNLCLKAQIPPVIQWQKSLGGSGGESANAVQQTTDGGYITAGYSYSTDGDVSGNHGDADAWVVKLSDAGIIQWQKSLGGSNYDDAYITEQTSDGGYITAGTSYSNDGDVSGNHGDADFWIIKLGSSGSIEWQKSLGGNGADGATSIKQTPDNGYILVGVSYSNDGDVSGNHGDADFWIIKLDSNGNIVWQKSLGGSLEDWPYSVNLTIDGGYIVAGYAYSGDGDVSSNHGAGDSWIVKLNNAGSIEWQKSLGGSNGDAAYSIQQTTDGGYIIAGASDSDDGDVTSNYGARDYWIVKLDGNGNITWQKNFGGSNDDAALSVQQTSDGGYITSGIARSNDVDVTGNHGAGDSWIIKLDNNGAVQWKKSMGGSDDELASSIVETSDNGYIIAGAAYSNDGDVTGFHGGFGDFWIIKLAPDAVLPVTLLNLSGEVNGKANLLHWTTATEKNNMGFEIQRSDDGYNFNKIGFVHTKAASGNSSLKLNYDFSDIGFGTAANYYRLKQTDRDGKFMYSDIIVLKGANTDAGDRIKIYPNPVKNMLNIKIAANNYGNIRLSVSDMSGKIVLNKSTLISTGELIIQLNISHLSAGTYFLKIDCDGSCENMSKKFIKE